MRLPLIPLATLLLLALAAIAPTPAAAQDGPGACVGSACPNGYPACVYTGVDPRFDFCVADPQCFAVVWFDQRVGPYHVWASGCAIHVEAEWNELHDVLP